MTDGSGAQKINRLLKPLLATVSEVGLENFTAESHLLEQLVVEGGYDAARIPLLRQVLATARSTTIRTAYLGPEGSFSQDAVYCLVAENQLIEQPEASLDDIFTAVAKGNADYGVVPIENSTEGAVNRTMDLLREHNLHIHAEARLKIRHSLLHQSGRKEEITAIYAHPQALAQCRAWLASHFSHAEIKNAQSNAQAALMASKDSTVAAIASERAAKIYDLYALAHNIQDDPDNQTRFLLIAKPPYPVIANGMPYRTTLILAVKNCAGALYNLLKPLADNAVSMTRFESRPCSGGLWEYFFYMDIAGAVGQDNVDKALQELQVLTEYYKNLGSYPCFSG